MKQVYKFKALSGQSIIEVLIAFGVIVVLGIALVSAGLLTQRTSISARNNTQATKLAQGYLEQARVIRDVLGYSVFSGYNPGCYTIAGSQNSDPATWALDSDDLNSPQVGGCNVGTAPLNGEDITFNNVHFFRRLTLSAPDANNRNLTVEVSWKEGINDRTVTAKTMLSKWCEGTITGLAGSTCAL